MDISERRRLVKVLKNDGLSRTDIASQLGVSIPTISGDMKALPVTSGDVVSAMLGAASHPERLGEYENRGFQFDVMPGGRILSATFKRAQAAISTSTAPGIVDTLAAAVDFDASADYYVTMRSLFRLYEPPGGDVQAVPIPELSVQTSESFEGAARPGVVGVTFASSAPVRPRTMTAVADLSGQLLLQSPDIYDTFVDELSRESYRAIFERILTGPYGLLLDAEPRDAHLTEKAAADLSNEASFRSAAHELDESTPMDSAAWILTESLYRDASTTSREPGSDVRVVEDGHLLGERTIRTTASPEKRAVWSSSWRTALTVVLWPTQQLVIDKITQPGTTKLSLLTYFAWRLTRPARVSILRAA